MNDAKNDEFGLSASHLRFLFPFHFVINRHFQLVQIGPNLIEKFDVDIRLNSYMDKFFELSTPSTLLNWGYLRSIQHEACTLKHKKTQIDFSTKILPIDADNLLFLIKPLISTQEHLTKLGLNAADFANHDLISDLFLRKQHKKKLTLKKDVSLADLITTQEQQLKEIHQLLANQEAESRKLAHIISRSTNWIITANSSYTIEWVNTALTNDAKFFNTSLIGSDLLSLLFNVDSIELDKIKETLLTQSHFQKTLQFTADNQKKWIDLDIQALLSKDNQIVNIVAIGRDITEQKEAQLRSEQLTLELNNIFALSPDGFVSFDGNGHLSRVNSAFLDMTDISYGSLKTITAEAFDSLLDSINIMQPSATLPTSDISILKLANPKLTYIRRTKKEVYDDNPLGLRTINYFQNITHEYELSKMKGEFLSIAAHELKTPMASIYGFTDLLIKREYSKTQSKEILENIFRQASRMTNLINDLLDLARIEAKGKLALNPESLSVKILIHTAIKEFAAHTKNREIKLGDYDLSLKIKGNFEKLMQVMANLLSNAHKYSALEKPILIEVIDRNKDMENFVGIRIIDEGIGMVRSDLNNLFEPFFRSKNASLIPGTGLGMKIIKEIVELHDGTIEVTSESSAGTQVTIWIPKI